MRLVALVVLLAVTCACNAAAAGRVRVATVGKLTTPTARRAWSVRLAVRPASFSGTIRVTASGPTKLNVKASGGRGSYRARLVFPSAGRWSLTARAGASTSRLGVVTVRPAPPQPVAFSEPTSIELEPAGTLVVVENSPGRVVRVDPQNGRVTTLVPSVTRPYASVHTPSGSVLVTSGNLLRRIDAAGALTTIAEANGDIGPVAVAPGGDVFFTTSTQIFRLVGGAGAPVRIAGTGAEGGSGDGGPALSAQFSAPHGLAIADDGALLVSDAGNDRVRRIDLSTGVITAFAQIGTPHGIDVGADGTVYVVDSRANRVVRLSRSGVRIGFVGPAFGLPYDVEVASDGVVFVLEAGPVGWVRRVSRDGSVTTVSRS
jgi:sugar lactone lactonase YvrE